MAKKDGNQLPSLSQACDPTAESDLMLICMTSARYLVIRTLVDRDVNADGGVVASRVPSVEIEHVVRVKGSGYAGASAAKCPAPLEGVRSNAARRTSRP